MRKAPRTAQLVMATAEVNHAAGDPCDGYTGYPPRLRWTVGGHTVSGDS